MPWIRNRVDTKSGFNIVLSGDVTESSPVLYREYCVQDGNLVPRFSLLLVEESTLLCAFFFDFLADSAVILDTNFARLTTHTLMPIFPEESWVHVWTWKFLKPQRKICRFKNIWVHYIFWCHLTFLVVPYLCGHLISQKRFNLQNLFKRPISRA